MRVPLLAVVGAGLVVAAGAAFVLGGRNTPPSPAQPDVARELDRLAPGTTVAAKAAFTGSCTGTAGAFDITGEAIRYGNGSRSLTAQAKAPAAGAQPASISLDSAWWEASGGKAGRITLAANAIAPGSGATQAITCDVDLPAAP